MTIGHAVNAAAPHGAVHGGLSPFSPHTLQAGAVVQVFAHPHLGIEGHVFGQVADHFFHGFGFRKDILPTDGDAAAARRVIAREHLQRGALSGAVGPQESHDFPFGNFKRNAVHGRHSRIFLGQMLNLDQGCLLRRINRESANLLLD